MNGLWPPNINSINTWMLRRPRASQVAEKDLDVIQTSEKHFSEPEGPVDFAALTARLKSCLFKTSGFSAACSASIPFTEWDHPKSSGAPLAASLFLQLGWEPDRCICFPNARDRGCRPFRPWERRSRPAPCSPGSRTGWWSGRRGSSPGAGG